MNELLIVDQAERFLRLHSADGAATPRTLTAYRQNIGYFCAWAAGRGTDARVATHDDVLAYRLELVSLYARATVRLRLTGVRLLFKSLQYWGLRADNPAEGVRAPKTKEDAASLILQRSISPENAKKLIKNAPEGRDGAILRLFIYHGCRAGEVSALRHEDLSIDRTLLNVPGKGGKRRMLVLSYRCRQDLASATPGALFKRRGGGSLSVRSIERIINRQLEAVGAKESGKSCHSLRHTSAVLATLGGVKKEALAVSLGHSNTNTTDIYALAAAVLQENPSNAVERALQ